MKQDSLEYTKSYEKQAAYYDAIYEAQGKDYGKEARQIHEVIDEYKKSEGNELLDVGCGTGGHFPFLREWYSIEGLDIDPHMLQAARQRFPDITFHQIGSLFSNTQTGYDFIQWYGFQEIMGESILSLEEQAEIYKNISAQHLLEATRKYFRKDNIYIAVVGKVEEKKILELVS